MNTNIQVFNHPQFGMIRVCMKGDKVLFCLSDVCKSLDIVNSRNIKKRLDERGVHSMDTPTENQFGASVMQQMTYIDEPNLYRCIFQSRKAEAIKFQDWVFEEVLPLIRQTGGYINVNDNDDDCTIMAKALTIAQKTIEHKNRLLEAQRPKVLFANAVSKSVNSILVRDLAKMITQAGYPIGAGRLFYWLRLKEYLFKRELRPRQEWVERGIFEICVTTYKVGDKTFEKIQTRVTGTGQQYFVNGFVTGRFCAENGNFK